MKQEMDETRNHRPERDPLGLGELPLLDPPADGWAEVRAALEADHETGQGHRRLGWFAAAASVVLVAGVIFVLGPQGPEGDNLPTSPALAIDATPGGAPTQPGVESGDLPAGATPASEAADEVAMDDSVRQLIAMSQGLEQRLRFLRDNTGAMPAESAIYLAELEDLVARVDSQLSDTPESPELWSQRVNLLLDLEALFQHRFEREYGRMASL